MFLLLLSVLLVPELAAFRLDTSFDAVKTDAVEADAVKVDAVKANAVAADAVKTDTVKTDADIVEVVEVEVEVDASEEDGTQHPNFSGHYILDRVEGQPDHAAYNAGVGWLQRQAAYAASYGAGTLSVDLIHNGDHFDIRSSTPLGSSRVQFDVGGGRQSARASDGGRFDIDPVWRGNEVRATMWRGSHVTHIKRFMRGNNMIIESTIDGYYHNARTREVYKPRRR